MTKYLFILICLKGLLLSTLDKSYAEQADKHSVKLQSQYSLDDVVIEQYKWQGSIPDSGKVKVINNFGAISIKNINPKMIAVTGAIQLIGDSPAKAQVITTVDNGIQIIEVVYPQGNIDKLGRTNGRVDLGIFVPKSVTVNAITDFGAIKSRKLRSNLIAQTNSGKIKIGSSSTIQAKTNTGNIQLTLQKESSNQARFTESSKPRFSRITSTAGDIKIYLQDKANITLSAYSQQNVESNLLANQYTKITEQAPKSFKAILGKGTRHYEIETQTGEISIYRSELTSILPPTQNKQQNNLKTIL